MNEGFISLDRKFTEWEWYTDANTMRVFIHLLFNANWKDTKYKGQVIPRGSLITSRRKLSRELKIPERQIRTAIDHLISTNEVTIDPSHLYSIVTIVKYDVYQNPNRHTDPLNDPQSDQQPTHDRPSNIKQYKQYNNIDNICDQKPKKNFKPPSVDEVRAYIQEKGYKVDADTFVNFYDSKGWMVGKNKMKDWKASVRYWASKSKKEEPKKDGFNNFTEREDTDWDNIELALLQRR